MYQSGGVRTQNFSLFIECSPTTSLRWGPYPDQSITIIEKNYEWHNVTGWPGWWQEAQICRNLQLRRKQVRRLKFWHRMVEYQGIGVPWELVSVWVDPPVRGAAGENLTAWPALNEQNFARWDTLLQRSQWKAGLPETTKLKIAWSR